MGKIYNSVLDEIQDFLDSYKTASNFSSRKRSNGLRNNLPVIEPPPYREGSDPSNFRSGGKYSKDDGDDSGSSVQSANNNQTYNQKTDAKGDGPTQFESFTLRLPPSSTIQTSTYWPAENYLTVAFKSGSSYEYTNVPMMVIKAWMLAGSAGSFFYYNIRTSFKYTKI